VTAAGRRQKAIGLLVVMVALVAAAAPAAPEALAGAEFGDACSADSTSVPAATPQLYFQVTAPGDPLPLAAPGSGVLTEWRVDSGQAESFSETVKVLHPIGGLIVRVTGESTGTVGPGQNDFPTRLPIEEGDRLAFYLAPGTKPLLCTEPKEATLLEAYEGDSSLGSTILMLEDPAQIRFPLVGVVEPDADGDGFGDETQDQCPQSAATQGPCPPSVSPPTPSSQTPSPPPRIPISLDASATAGRGAVTVFVTADSQATVTVAGAVRLGEGRALKLSGGTQTIVPGALARFVLHLPRKLDRRLKELKPGHSLSVDLSASAPNASGPASIESLKVRLRGQTNRRSPPNPGGRTTQRGR
jgi:hypothetical protein